MTARSRPRLAAVLTAATAILVAGCYSKIPVEDGGTMSTADAEKPAMTPLEREQAAAQAEQRKRVASLARADPGEAREVASVDLTAEPDAAARDDVRAATASAVSPGAGGYWVQVGSGRDQKDSEALWNKLRERHSAILGNAAHAIVRADLGPGKGVFYRVHVGPYDSAGSASALCGRLRAAGADCFLIGPRGSIIAAPEPRSAKVEPTAPPQAAPADPSPAPAPPATTARPAPAAPTPEAAPKSPAKPAAEPAARTVESVPPSANPPASKPSAAGASEPDPAGAKSSEAKSDVPFRTMGLPGLPE